MTPQDLPESIDLPEAGTVKIERRNIFGHDYVIMYDEEATTHINLSLPRDGNGISGAESQIRRLEAGVSISVSGLSSLSAETARIRAAMLTYAAEVVERLNKGYKDRIAELEAEASKEEEERRKRIEAQRKAAEERRKVIDERKERCLMEFADEPVRARARGYKQAVRAYVRVREIGDGDAFIPYIEYVNENDWSRPTDIGAIMRLEYKQGSRYKVVWDDGREDLSPWDRGADAEKEHKIKPLSVEAD
jgi:hypothetical protein